ncbi:helix-turn-helix domain-containing protein [Streptomyces sp. URMC 126]|uniref:helix-turn-helix domain-containing protein n=1 Tax=Streptomyces sp. URMC 126 TaxID=3423401 RepID=UPI003F1DA3BF
MSVARGMAAFDGDALRSLRAERPVDGRLLTAAELAERVGTSKTRILAYENGRSVPDPRRIADLAAVFDVPTARLTLSSSRHPTLRELRVQAGLTTALVAGALGVSRGTYRDIELRARLPVRDDGTLRRRLADVLGVPPRKVNKALHHHPLAAERRAQLTRLLGSLFERARTLHAPAVVERDDPELLAVAALVQRAPSSAVHLVNHELSRFRQLLRERAVAEVDAAYAQSGRDRRRAVERQARLIELIDGAPEHSAHLLSGFLAMAMSARQWRIMVMLAEAGPDGLPVGHETETGVWSALRAREFVVLASRGDQEVYVLSHTGRVEMRRHYRLYACLYPRTRTPALLPAQSPHRAV